MSSKVCNVREKVTLPLLSKFPSDGLRCTFKDGQQILLSFQAVHIATFLTIYGHEDNLLNNNY